MLNLFEQGGWCDDFLSHFMCCCCALVQELREVEIREIDGMYVLPQTFKIIPHSSSLIIFVMERVIYAMDTGFLQVRSRK